MDKRFAIAAGIVLLLAVGLLVGVLTLSSSPKTENVTSATNGGHTETNSGDGYSDTVKAPKDNTEDLTSQSTVAIDIADFKYSKANIKIKKGTKVTWTNRDPVKHNVMRDGGSSAAPDKNEVKPDMLAGQLLARGESYSFTFNKTGTDPYHCSPHPYMKGSVTVVE